MVNESLITQAHLQGVQRIYGRFCKYEAINQKSKQPSTKISYILKSGILRDANSKEKTNFWQKVLW